MFARATTESKHNFSFALLTLPLSALAETRQWYSVKDGEYIFFYTETFDPRCIGKKVKPTDIVLSSGRLRFCRSEERSPERLRAGREVHSSARPLLTFTVALSVRKVRAGLQNPGSIRRPCVLLFLLYLSWWTCCSWCFSGQWWESDKNLLLLQIFPSLRPAFLALTGESDFGPDTLTLFLCLSFPQGMPEVKWKRIYDSGMATLQSFSSDNCI